MPGECSLVSYDLEYGSASVELQKNAFEFSNKQDKKSRVMIVDDLLATGGTMKAACDLINAQDDAIATHAYVLMELKFINGCSKLPSNIHFESLIKYE